MLIAVPDASPAAGSLAGSDYKGSEILSNRAFGPMPPTLLELRRGFPENHLLKLFIFLVFRVWESPETPGEHDFDITDGTMALPW